MQIHAILMQQDESEWAWEPSLKVAAEVMSHVLTIGEAIQAKDDATMSHADFPDIVSRLSSPQTAALTEARLWGLG